MESDHQKWMALAERIGAMGAGQTGLNPSVGCVIVKDGRLVGRGVTQAGGRPHAERVALEIAGSNAKGAVAYVTLEPCAHHGKTSPCSQALIEAGVRVVVCPWRDPDLRVNGGGFEALQKAGVEVITMNRPMNAGLRAFFINQTQKRPLVALKLATSMDGKIALENGESQWISGEIARGFTRGLRADFHAIAVGANTAFHDNPSLTTRLEGLTDPRPVIFDSTLRLSPNSTLYQNTRSIFVVDQEQQLASNVESLKVAKSENGLDLKTALARLLKEYEIGSLLVEGGGQLAASFIRAGLVDIIYHVTTGALMGGDARVAIGALGLETMGDVSRFTPFERMPLGKDTLIEYHADHLDFENLRA